jgi:hypothetical protein
VEFISEFLKASQEINWMFFRGKWLCILLFKFVNFSLY